MSTAPKHQTHSIPASTPHLTAQPARELWWDTAFQQLSSSHIQSQSRPQHLPSLSSLSPESFRDPQQHQAQAPANAPLHSTYTGVNQQLKARENQLSSAAKGEEMLCFHLYNLLFSKLPVWYEPAALCLPFPWRRLDSHTTTCTAATQSDRFPTRERRRAKQGIRDERIPVLSLLS